MDHVAEVLQPEQQQQGSGSQQHQEPERPEDGAGPLHGRGDGDGQPKVRQVDHRSATMALPGEQRQTASQGGLLSSDWIPEIRTGSARISLIYTHSYGFSKIKHHLS